MSRRKLFLIFSKKILTFFLGFGIICLASSLEAIQRTSYAGMAELADAHGSGPCEHCVHEGSSPFSCIIFLGV